MSARYDTDYIGTEGAEALERRHGVSPRYNLYMVKLRSWPEGVLVGAMGSEDALRAINRPGWTFASTEHRRLWRNVRGPSRVVDTLDLHAAPGARSGIERKGR